MPPANSETVSRSYEAFNDGRLDEAISYFHPDIEWSTYVVPGPGGATYRGHDGVRQLWSDVRNVFDEFRNDPERFFESGDQVVVFVRFTGCGRVSGAAVEASVAHLFTFRDGLVASVRTYEDRVDALRAAAMDDI
jgi:ketosteroid isomerase-like protein